MTTKKTNVLKDITSLLDEKTLKHIEEFKKMSENKSVGDIEFLARFIQYKCFVLDGMLKRAKMAKDLCLELKLNNNKELTKFRNEFSDLLARVKGINDKKVQNIQE